MGACLAWAFALTSSAYRQSKMEIKSNAQLIDKFGLHSLPILYGFRINETSINNQAVGTGKFSYLLIGKNRVGTVTITNKKTAPETWETVEVIN